MRQQFQSDLSDEQWEKVQAFGRIDSKSTADLREVVNALLYRERSNCPWQLMPPGFPDKDCLRQFAESWKEDGTWPRIRRIIDQSPSRRLKHPLSRLDNWRSSAAENIKRFPGGALFLAAGRPFVRIAEWITGRFSIHARLPGWFEQGHRLAVAGKFAAAAEYFTRVIDVDADNAPALLRRANAYMQLGRLDNVCRDCRQVLSLSDLKHAEITEAHFYLSEALVLLGELDRSLEHAFVARLLTRYGPHSAWGNLDTWETGGLTPGPDEFELVCDSHNDLAESAINRRSDFATAETLYQRGEHYRRRYAEWLEQVPTTTLFLSQDWVRNIGHMALIDFMLKMQRLGWQPWKRLLLMAPDKVTANPSYLDYYTRFFKVIRSDQPPTGIKHLTAVFGPRVASLMTCPDGSTRYFTEGMGLIQEAWEREQRGPLLIPNEADVVFGRKQLAKMGVPPDAWFVALHARSPGFHKEGRQNHQSHRNAAIASYLPAVKEIVRRGGWVIRLGDKSMEPFPETPGVIDYARSALKSSRLDIFLCSNCRFYIGGASGLSHVPTTFGVPCLLTNWLSNALPVYSRHDLFVPKMLRSVAEDRLLSFDEYLTPETRLLCYSGSDLDSSGYAVVDNTAEELRGVVAEMLDNLDGVSKPEGDENVMAFDTLARRHGLVGFSRIGRDFALRHRRLLPLQASNKAA
jgi:putative glycosyltransferase (TIGR04372 family)